MKRIPVYCLCLLLFVLHGCTLHQEDFISKYCPGSCTVIKGRLTTDDGSIPLPGVQLLVQWQEHGTLGIGGTIRKKAVATTDANGNYKLSFLLRDTELSNNTDYQQGYITVDANINSNQYITCHSKGRLQQYYDLTRDTIITLDYTLPQKAFVEVEASNLQAMGYRDSFITEAIFKAGENTGSNCGDGIYWNSNTPTQSYTLKVAANQTVVLRTTKRSNNTETVTESTLTLKPGQRTKVQVAF